MTSQYMSMVPLERSLPPLPTLKPASNGTLSFLVSSPSILVDTNLGKFTLGAEDDNLTQYSLVYAGVGWIIWRDESYLPKHLVFELHYLGGTEESYTLNFSRPGVSKTW